MLERRHPSLLKYRIYQRQSSKIGRMHGKPVRSAQQLFGLHVSGDVDDISRCADASLGAHVEALVESFDLETLRNEL